MRELSLDKTQLEEIETLKINVIDNIKTATYDDAKEFMHELKGINDKYCYDSLFQELIEHFENKIEKMKNPTKKVVKIFEDFYHDIIHYKKSKIKLNKHIIYVNDKSGFFKYDEEAFTAIKDVLEKFIRKTTQKKDEISDKDSASKSFDDYRRSF